MFKFKKIVKTIGENVLQTIAISIFLVGGVVFGAGLYGGIDLQGNNLENGRIVFFQEQAGPDASVPGKAQILVDDETPNNLLFVDDEGTEFQLNQLITGGDVVGPASGSISGAIAFFSNLTGKIIDDGLGRILSDGNLLLLEDNVPLIFGTGNDATILHNNTDTVFHNHTGQLLIENDGGDIILDPNGGVGIGATPDASAALHVVSASKGVLFSPMTESERDNIPSAANGLQVTNITDDELNVFFGSKWNAISTHPTEGLNIHSETIQDYTDVIVRSGQSGHLDTAIATGTFVPATQPTSPVLSIAMAWDGSKLFLGDNAARLNGYDLSTPWDITTASDLVDQLAPGFSVQGVVFSFDGFDLIVNQGAGIVRQFVLTTPWDLTTATTVTSVTPTEPTADISDISISPDGHNLYLFASTTGIIHQYFLSKSFDLSTIGSTQVAQQAIGISSTSFSGDFSNDGRILIAFASGTFIKEYHLGIAWDITSVGSLIKNFDVGNNDTRGIVVKPDGTRFYTTTLPDGADNADANQFDIGLVTSNILTDGLLSTDIVRVQADTDATVGYIIADDLAADQAFFVYNDQSDLTSMFSIADLAINSISGAVTISSNLSTLDFNAGSDITFNVIGATGKIVLNAPEGVVPSLLTSIERDAIVSPSTGTQIHNTDTRRTEFFDDLDGSGSAWQKISVVAPTTVEIFTAADLDALATGGVITVSVPTTFKILTPIVTDIEFSITGDTVLNITGDEVAGSQIVYTGSGTVFSGSGTLNLISIDIIGNASATLLNFFDSPGSISEFVNANVIGFGNLGTIDDNFAFLFRNVGIVSNTLGFTITNTSLDVLASAVFNMGDDALFDISGSATPIQISTSQIAGNNGGSSSLFKIDPGIHADSRVSISGSTITIPSLFDTSGGTTGTFFDVTDSTVALTTIDSVTDSSGVARFNFTVGPTVFVDQQIDNVNCTETSYNQTGIITATGAGFYEIASIAFTGDDATCDFSSDSVTIHEISTVLVDGDTLVINTTAGTQYDGGAGPIYNKLVSSFQINRTFSISRAGTWDTSPIDQSDVRILASLNPSYASSIVIATGESHQNVVATTILDGTYVTIQLGAFFSSSEEQLKHIANGVYEVTSNEPISLQLTGSTSQFKSGATLRDYRLSISVDGALPVYNVDPLLSDPYEDFFATSDANKIPIALFSGELTKGQTVQVMVAGQGNTDDLTFSNSTLIWSEL